MKSIQCKSQWHVIVAHLWRLGTWQPTHLLQSIDTEYGFIGSSGEQRVRELAANSPKVMALHPELKDAVEKKREGKYEYFKFVPRSQRLCRRFDAGQPAEEVFA